MTDSLDDKFNRAWRSLSTAMPKGFGCADACVKIGQREDKDGRRTYETFSEGMKFDWWTSEVTWAMGFFAECCRMPETKFGHQLTFEETIDDVELVVTVTKITNWVFLVNVVNDVVPPETEKGAEDPK